jgi:aryl sulfotransferase
MPTEQTRTGRTRYRAPVKDGSGATLTWLADSARWDDFDWRAGDIVISAPAKCGTTWTQMICALLVFQTADLPAPLTELSPWLDMLVRPISDVRAQLAAQRHRRFIKTHTPLDGVPFDDRVTYVAVGRDPRDVALSLHHHRANLAHEAVLRALNAADTELVTDRRLAPTDVREDFLQWMNDGASPLDDPYTLRALVGHQRQAWSRRDDPNLVLVHYADLSRDLEAQMRRIADSLDIHVPEKSWPALIAAASFEQMRERSAQLVPDERLGLIADPARFFRAGSSGGWRNHLTDSDVAAYRRRLASLATPDIINWLHHGNPDPT